MTTSNRLSGSLFVTIGHLVYGVYAWITFFLLVLMAILFSIIVPGLERRRHWVSAPGRWFFALAGIKTSVSGVDSLPPGHCIVVANHASYLDGVILQCLLPPRFAYVIKGEVQKVPVLHFVLRRIGSRFVDRFTAAGSARDARALVRAASAGESLAFFPEGTFKAEIGLQRFRPGAFAAAIKAELPVVPVVISGSRYILPAGSLLPRRGPISVDILPALATGDGGYTDSKVLSATARQQMLSILDEPDLAQA